MTKSQILIIGDQPEDLLERHRADYSAVLKDVTATLHTLIRDIATAPFPAGINPSPQFREKLAQKRAIARLFGGQPHWIYDRPEDAPKQHILHNHVIFDGERIVAALRKTPAGPSTDDPGDSWRNNPFDYWWQPEIAYLPLRQATTDRPFHRKTVPSALPPYYADLPSSDAAAKGDVDLTSISQARRKTTRDLLQKSEQVLAASGLGLTRDWQPRFQSDGWNSTENPAYHQQPKVKMLLDAMPEHAKHLDYLLLDQADLWLHTDWAAIPVAGLITKAGYANDAAPETNTADQLFFQITGTSRPFLQALRDAWQDAPADQLISIFRVHE